MSERLYMGKWTHADDPAAVGVELFIDQKKFAHLVGAARKSKTGTITRCRGAFKIKLILPRPEPKEQP